LTALLLLVVYTATAIASSSIPRRHSSSFANLHRISSTSSQNIHQLKNIPRGGDDDEYDSEEYDSDEYDSEEEEEVEPIVTKTKKLASSTKNVVQTKKRKEVKSKVKVALSSSSAKSKSVSSRSNNGGGIYKRYVPYIIRAVLNPFVLMRMTKSYFVSLCDINYLKEVSLYVLSLCVFGGGTIGVENTKNKTRSMYIYTISS